MKYKLRNKYSTNPDKALKEILIDRGVTDIEHFMNPSEECELNPFNLTNIDAAADMLLMHLRRNSKILFIVDADCDGFTSSSILWLYIKHTFPEVELEFTVHEHKQHGLDDKIDWITDEARWDLVIVPDAGSYDIKEHRALGELGMDVLVLDHHEQLYDDQGNPVISDLPTTVVVNNQLSPNYSNKSLCGAGVVYKFCEVLDSKLGISLAHNYIDLAALGEIADVMDRTNVETNYIMIEGLKNIHNEGFRTLIESQAYSLKDKAVSPYVGLTPIDIAFYIAPLINAITRVGTIKEKEAMFYCFIEPDKPLQSTKRGAKIGDIENLQITASIPERYVGDLKIGLKAEISLEAYPGQIFSATVVRVSPVLDAASRTKQVILNFDKKDSRVNAGMFAKVKLYTVDYVNVISIAQDAIVTVNDSSYLYVVKEDSTVEKRLITLGKNVNGYYQITSGIEPNEKVVVAGMLTLTDGAKVKDITETAN